MGKRKNVILPPALPPDEEVELSEEDVVFVRENTGYAEWATKFDRRSIDRHVTRVADKNEDEIERLYEKRNKKAAFLQSQDDLQVDRVDALPIKTLDGKLQYRTAKKARTEEEKEESSGEENGEGENGKNVIKLTKAERRQKLKKERKEFSKNLKIDEESEPDSPKKELHTEVLKQVEEELTAEESFEKKKIKLAELGLALLEDPEANIRSLMDILQICNDRNPEIVKLGLMSLLAVFKDIIPSYRIRELTQKELSMQVSEAVRKTRFYEYTLLRSYKAYLQKLMFLEKKQYFKQVSVRCICALLEAAPHFNFRETLLIGTVRNISSSDDLIRKLCCEAIKSLFTNEGKHGGEATLQAVRLISNQVKLNNCQMNQDTINVFLCLRFDESLGKSEKKVEEKKKKNDKRWSKKEDPKSKIIPSDKKKLKRELIAKTRVEVNADFKAVSFAPDSKERQRMQSETLASVFQTYFRILKHAIDSTAHPLLAPCLEGLAKFSHMIDLDFMADLLSCLKELSGFTNNNNENNDNGMSVSERLQCCIVAFKVMKSNLDALNVDLQDFFVQLYNLLLEYRPLRDRGEILAEALKIMLWDGRQHDTQRAAAFIKRLATFSLSFGTGEAMSALVTLRLLLQKNTKCRNLLENDAGGGSLSGLVVKYQPEATDPYLSGALASVLWELSLLTKHYNPSISQMASNILSLANLNPAQSNINPNLIAANPIQAFWDLSIEKELSKPIDNKLPAYLKKKRKRESGREFCVLDPEKMRSFEEGVIGEDDAKVRFEEHFKVLRDISENERVKAELNKTMACVGLYEEFKREKKNNGKDKKKNKKSGKGSLLK
ncbi:hypothetical protein LUZ60_009553 [Juncus effusus]|nr:hypothetical protein LUZ60_009553 [Juncus effusus]